MATPTTNPAAITLEIIDRAWIRKAIEALRASLVRSRNKELEGSDIWLLRGKEIEALTTLLARF